MITEAIGTHFKSVRMAHGLTQTEAAKLIGVDQSALSRLENGKQNLTVAQWLSFIFSLKAEDDLAPVVRNAIKKRGRA